MKLLLHPAAAARVHAIVANPGGSVLLHGARGVGKSTVAIQIARQMNCLGCTDDSCRSCRMVMAGNHPDIITVAPNEKGKIGIEQVHQLLHDLQYERYESAARRVVIITEAHQLTLPAQNSLLKCLEEPPGNATIILTCENLSSLLPTIISRCQTAYIPPVSNKSLIPFLNQLVPDRAAQVSLVAGLSQGAVGTALTLLRNADALDQHQRRMTAVQELFEEGELFARLQLASAMASSDDSDNYVAMVTWLSHNLVRKGTNPHILSAVERLRERLSANVSPRTAFEALAVELA